MINYLIKIITTLWFISFCLQVSVAQEIGINQTRKHLLQTLQDNSVDKQQRMELYIDLYDLSDDVTSKRTYINESLQLAIQFKNQIYIFETLDILCRSYKDEPDSLHYYQQIGEECLEGAYKNFYMAWLKAFPSVCKMDEAEKPDEANEEISRYKRHKVNLSDKSQEVQWEMILCSAMECVSYFAPSVTSAEDRITHLQNIHQLVRDLPFEVSYKFDWYYLTRIEFLLRAGGKADEAVKAVEALEQLEQLYDNQFELPFYKRRAYLRIRNREALRMGVYSELLYFGDVIGREKMDEIYSRMENYYQDETSKESKNMLLPSSFRYYLYTRQYDLAMQTINELLAQTDTTDTNRKTELLAKKIDLITQWEQHYKEGFDAFWEYTSLMEDNHVEETNRQLAEMRSLFEVDKLKIEQAELQTRYHRIALVVLIVLLLIFLLWSLYQYRLTKRLKATKEALILSNKKVAEESERAKASDRMKTEFLQSMCHEIRTPLNAIVGFSRIIAESTDAEERKNYYDIVEANNERLLQLINEILDLSKIEAGMVEFTIAPMRLHLLCNEIYNALKFRCPMGVELVYEASDEDIVIEGDKNRIFQVVSNLIGNAFKFTTNGSVSYGYRRKGSEIEFHVSDTGIGIEADKLSKVFERFVKVNNFAQGTGLGLSICKTIIERLGGTISVSSEMGKGTTFLFTLPLSESKKEAAAKQKETTDGQKETADEQNKTSGTNLNASGNTEKSDTVSDSREEPQELQEPQEPEASKAPTILIAEDTDSNYVLVKAILGKLYRLERAKDGMEAVTMFEELHPELILMDMKMPNLGGLDATKIIRELSPKTPIIALTAYAYEHDKQAAIDAGCNDFLTKPYTQEVLKEMIKKYLK